MPKASHQACRRRQTFGMLGLDRLLTCVDRSCTHCGCLYDHTDAENDDRCTRMSAIGTSERKGEGGPPRVFRYSCDLLSGRGYRGAATGTEMRNEEKKTHPGKSCICAKVCLPSILQRKKMHGVSERHGIGRYGAKGVKASHEIVPREAT